MTGSVDRPRLHSNNHFGLILYVTGNNQDLPFKDCFKLKSNNIVVMYNSLEKYVQNYTIHANPSIFLSPWLSTYILSKVRQ